MIKQAYAVGVARALIDTGLLKFAGDDNEIAPDANEVPDNPAEQLAELINQQPEEQVELVMPDNKTKPKKGIGDSGSGWTGTDVPSTGIDDPTGGHAPLGRDY